MTDNRTGLPEGTDKVIGGASGSSGTGISGTGGTTGTPGGPGTSPTSGAGSTGGGAGSTVTADTTLVTETEIPAPRGDAERPTSGSGTPGGGTSGGATGGGTSGQTGGSVVEKIRSGGEKLTGQAAEKARGLVSQGLERSADALGNVGRLVGDTATGLDERLGPEFGDYARRAASTIEETANRIAAKDPEELIDDTRDFVRRSPTVALAGAAIVGFAVARLIKTGVETARGGGSSGGNGQQSRNASSVGGDETRSSSSSSTVGGTGTGTGTSGTSSV